MWSMTKGTCGDESAVPTGLGIQACPLLPALKCRANISTSLRDVSGGPAAIRALKCRANIFTSLRDVSGGTAAIRAPRCRASISTSLRDERRIN